jgi:hypothetical protein
MALPHRPQASSPAHQIQENTVEDAMRFLVRWYVLYPAIAALGLLAAFI